MSIKITCIKKTTGNHENEFVAISELHWQNEQTLKSGKSTRVEMYNWIQDGGIAYIKDIYGKKVNLIAATSPRKIRYVKTGSGDTSTDSLLTLPECP